MEQQEPEKRVGKVEGDDVHASVPLRLTVGKWVGFGLKMLLFGLIIGSPILAIKGCNAYGEASKVKRLALEATAQALNSPTPTGLVSASGPGYHVGYSLSGAAPVASGGLGEGADVVAPTITVTPSATATPVYAMVTTDTLVVEHPVDYARAVGAILQGSVVTVRGIFHHGDRTWIKLADGWIRSYVVFEVPGGVVEVDPGLLPVGVLGGPGPTPTARVVQKWRTVKRVVTATALPEGDRPVATATGVSAVKATSTPVVIIITSTPVPGPAATSTPVPTVVPLVFEHRIYLPTVRQ